jgi:pyruvate,water dikinase
MNYLLDLQKIDKTQVAVAGGKGANLGELCRVDGVQVPEGWCVTTEVFKDIVGRNEAFVRLVAQLDNGYDAAVCVEIRRLIAGMVVPLEIAPEGAYAVRSSATAEDLPWASFAGQQDTYLNISGRESLLAHISKCWASLFTDRAVIYRIQQGIDHRQVSLAVVIQRMVFADVSGILFTADPVSGHRKVVSIDASFGLGEALVAGLVNADNYKVKDGEITGKMVSAKKLGIYAGDHGVKQRELTTEMQNKQALTDAQILQLAETGRKIEAHFGRPQDIEWCLAGEEFYIVQSRPITTLFPVPVADDTAAHVYISVGHQQMMTDAIRPLGLSIWQMAAARPMATAGGRLFVDIGKNLSTPAGRKMMLHVLGQHDPLIKSALLKLITDDGVPMPEAPFQQVDPAVVDELIQESQAAVAALKQNIQTTTSVFDVIAADISQLKQSIADPKYLTVIMAGMNAMLWINNKMQEWLGEKNVADTLSQSVKHNITSEMGLALLDVADALRPYADQLQSPDFPGDLQIPVLNDFLDKYGMRCAGEIDITRTRWSEQPSMLVPVILSHIRNLQPGESRRKFEQGLQEALMKEQDILSRLAVLPDGASKVAMTREMIGQLRDLIGYREYPKYGIVSRYYIYKQAILAATAHLVKAPEDIYYLTFEELRAGKIDDDLIHQRKEEYKLYERLTPPRVMTGDGEIITGQYDLGHLPENAIAGLAVSSGVVEGRARVILKMEAAMLEEGDILVTAFTDPSWTPLFVSIKGLVTEVGGLMTHGAVIAREYGLPAVVGVENATTLIRDGQRIRVNGTEGYIEIIV